MVLKLKNHLEGLLKLNCWLHHWSFWFNWSWVGLRVCIYQKFLGDAMLLVWGPHFGNLCVRGREEGTGEYLALNVIFLWSEIWFFKKSFIYLFLERRERREKVRKRNINVQEKHQSVTSCIPPVKGPACNSGTHPNWDPNQWPFGLWHDTQATEPHQSGLIFDVLKQNYDMP